MRDFLTNLSDELLLKIVDELLEHDKKLYDDSPQSNDDDNFKYHRDLMNWSFTSSYFRNLLAPLVFSVVNLRNDEKSAKSIETLLKGPHGLFIKKIHFIGIAPEIATNVFSDEFKEEKEGTVELRGGANKATFLEDDESVQNDLVVPKGVEKLLSNLQWFSGLLSLSIGFSYPMGSSFTEFCSDHYPQMRTQNTSGLGSSHLRRMMIKKIYSIISRHRWNPPFKTLEIREFVWAYTLPFAQLEFHELLTHLESFTLLIGSGDNHAETIPQYRRSFAQLDSFFFEHLLSATSLTLKASRDRPLGLKGLDYTPLSLKSGSMPKLRCLHLEDVFICEEVLNFVRCHAETFEELTLHYCYSGADCTVVQKPFFYWKDLFNGLFDAKLKRFTRLQILPLQPPLTNYEDNEIPYDESMESYEVLEIRSILKTDKTRRLFAYACLDDNHGFVYVDGNENIAAFQRGEDQMAYDRLRERMAENGTEGDHKCPTAT